MLNLIKSKFPNKKYSLNVFKNSRKMWRLFLKIIYKKPKG